MTMHLMRLLIENGADTLVTDEEGLSLLHIATKVRTLYIHLGTIAIATNDLFLDSLFERKSTTFNRTLYFIVNIYRAFYRFVLFFTSFQFHSILQHEL